MAKKHDPDYIAYRFLQVAFVIVPILAGLDKFFHFLTYWNQYLSSCAMDMINYSSDTHFMMFIGVLEIIIGVGNIVVPKVFGFITAGCLVLFIINLIVHGNFMDIALRDVGLCLSAIALGVMGLKHNTFR